MLSVTLGDNSLLIILVWYSIEQIVDGHKVFLTVERKSKVFVYNNQITHLLNYLRTVSADEKILIKSEFILAFVMIKSSIVENANFVTLCVGIDMEKILIAGSGFSDICVSSSQCQNYHLFI